MPQKQSFSWAKQILIHGHKMGITYNSKKNNQCANTRKLNKYTEDNNLIPYTEEVSHMEGIVT